MKTHSFLAFDIGATSGRAVLATICGERIDIKEISRFRNRLLNIHGKYYWNIYDLYQSLVDSLHQCRLSGITPHSIGIDTWGVDFGFISADGTICGLPRAYRDPYTENTPGEVFLKIPREELYRRTGIQIMPFNSLFQLYETYKETSSVTAAAKECLFIPDLLIYLLTGKKICEYTIASTSQLINPYSRSFDFELFDRMNIPCLFPAPITQPGTTVGTLTDELARETGLGRIPVVAVASHDTASAIAAVPASDQNFAYLSSGTWSLMGIETDTPIISTETSEKNFTNEGGIDGTIRVLKNITGMWLIERCIAEWKRQGKNYSYAELTDMARSARDFKTIFPPDATELANPARMTEAIASVCRSNGQPCPETDAEFVSCIFKSLAHRYKEVLDMMRTFSPHPIERLYIIGGGAKNEYLNQLTANLTGLPVTAGPFEATAIGNCMMQAKAAGIVANRWEFRSLIRKNFPVSEYLPQRSN